MKKSNEQYVSKALFIYCQFVSDVFWLLGGEELSAVSATADTLPTPNCLSTGECNTAGPDIY